MYGDDFLSKVRNIYIMGGNYKGTRTDNYFNMVKAKLKIYRFMCVCMWIVLGKGNISKSAEFNFMMDPEAAYIVLENVKEHVITILPWESCIDGDMNLDMVCYYVLC